MLFSGREYIHVQFRITLNPLELFSLLSDFTLPSVNKWLDKRWEVQMWGWWRSSGRGGCEWCVTVSDVTTLSMYVVMRIVFRNEQWGTLTGIHNGLAFSEPWTVGWLHMVDTIFTTIRDITERKKWRSTTIIMHLSTLKKYVMGGSGALIWIRKAIVTYIEGDSN